MFDIELVYSPANQELVHMHLTLPENATVHAALEQSGIYTRYPETRTLNVGIFSRPATKETRLQPGDRLEIYRPLALNPMEKRRLRAKKR